MPLDLKQASIKGVIWSFVENVSLKLIQFCINIVMARLLSPSDYGVLSIILVFTTISQIFIDGGFTTALIQLKDKTEKDFSTVYSFNIFISIICYLVLFLSAPWISAFYNCDLTSYLRVQSITLIIYALSAVHKTRLTINVDFKSIAKVGILSSLISGCLGVLLAFKGAGIWSLVFQSLIAAIVQTAILIVITKWKPICVFDKFAFKRLFSFGIKLMLANLIDRVYQNLYPLIVGKFYTSAQLGYYSRAEQFSTLPAGTCSDILLRVSFPVMSAIDDEEQLKRIYLKYVVLSSYLIFPVLFIVLLLARPIVIILLTEKWEEIIVLLQILCCGFLFDHISALNRNLLYVKGRSDLAFKLEIVKKIIATVILFASIPFGLVGLCVGKAIYGVTSFFLNSWYTRSLIGISIFSQIKDIMPSMVVTIITSSIVYLIIHNIENLYIQLFGGMIIFCIIYLSISYISRLSCFYDILSIIKGYLKRA